MASFNSLRTQRDKEPLHLWQLVHDAKEAVRKMSKATIEAMLTYAGEDENGLPVAELPNKAVPPSALLEIVELLNDGLTFEDAITNLRGRLVPDGYTPYPFRRDTPESTLDKYRSLMATYYYRHRIEELNQAGRNFKHHLFVPEIDEITGKEHHERGDHNHIIKRIAASTRECRYQDLNPEAFDKALLDPLAALTHAALTGQRQQSVEDAEKLLSYHVAASMQRNGYDTEAEYVTTIASWHEASDGRGMSQLQRCKANHQMLGYIVDELMPWQRDTYDFTYLDINRPMDNIRGFTRETFVEITTNIESQERRRILTSTVGYSEHPRASTTDDVECFFSLTRRQLGDTFSLKDFKNAWPKIVREFTKKMDPALPFYYWTQNNRFKVGETSFDEPNDNARLHTVQHSQREDSSIFTSGRAFLPARNKPSIRQRLFRVDVGLPPVPHMSQVGRG